MAIGNVEHMRECFREYLRMKLTRMKWDKDTEEECKKSKYGKKFSGHEKKTSPHGLTIVRANRPPGALTKRGRWGRVGEREMGGATVMLPNVGHQMLNLTLTYIIPLG